MQQIIGRYLVAFGIVFIIAGCAFLFIDKVPWLGKLPGDVLIKRDNFTFIFPITTCILVSIILSLIFHIFFKK